MEGLRWDAAAADAAGKRLEIFGVPSSCLELLVASELIFDESLFRHIVIAALLLRMAALQFFF